MFRSVAYLLFPSLLAVTAACTRSDSSKTQPKSTPTMIETTQFAPSLEVDISKMTKTPSGLYYRDLAVGNGAAAAPGNTVSVRYAGSLPNGRQFDATGPNDAPFSFRLGQQEVIGGWDEGVAGMKPGGRRQLVIPPDLGYGAQGSGPIPPNAILVFTVQLLNIE